MCGFVYVCFLGENEKPCVVTLLDDSIHEDDEEFRLVLGTSKSKSQYGAALGEQKETLVTITDKKDSEFTSTLNVKSALIKLVRMITWSYSISFAH